MKFKKYSKKLFFYLVSSILILWFVFSLENPLFKDPNSTIITDNQGRLLSARIADDGQWRFPEIDLVPTKFAKAITYFEDEYFYLHPGINPISILRALKQNIQSGKIVSGGSTLTMQTIRLSRKGKSRSIIEKLKEAILSLRLEISNNKSGILKLYASHAPFGGNVVGLEAASWRYFGRRPSQLSWGEICTLAVLPNAPALIYPGKNHEKLKAKRDRLLNKLYEKGEIDNETCELAKAEPLPGSPHRIPSISPHLLDRIIKDGKKGKKTTTTINLSLQEKVNKIVNNYHSVLSQNEIHNIAAIVLDVEKSTVLAYTGNSNCPEVNSGRNVDIITSPRSTGSILKPFLYTFMLQDGEILPNTLIPDIPTQYTGYAPKNFDKTYDGAVPASEALARSLNIPAVRMLRNYGIENFYHQLKKLDFKTIDKPANHYGLSIILGGAEATLWDLSNAYMNMAQTLNNDDFISEASYIKNDLSNTNHVLGKSKIFDLGALWWTFEALSSLNRPWQETGWQEFESSKKIAWKTGTSFGHRDGWAIGMTPKHVVGIWVGNADGEGRPGLTGLSVAAPILFKIFKNLEYKEWFEKPKWDLVPTKVCKKSGYLASDICEETEEILAPKNSVKTSLCPFHKIINLDKDKQFRVSSNCYSVNEMNSVSWFVLPPVQEWYFKKKNPFYKPLPSFKMGCQQELLTNMAVIYPKNHTQIFIPREIDGKMGKAVFEVVHRNEEKTIFWHLNNVFIGSTFKTHRMEIAPVYGKHTMTLVDEDGETISWVFNIL